MRSEGTQSQEGLGGPGVVYPFLGNLGARLCCLPLCQPWEPGTVLVWDAPDALFGPRGPKPPCLVKEVVEGQKIVPREQRWKWEVLRLSAVRMCPLPWGGEVWEEAARHRHPGFHTFIVKL